ncbi:right-handed parallel beta-helix repeat-containing protein [Oxalobacteraceae bacterium]|nr:right-handed parallel beta-helix repeat-containing protein [Oxalobacteraceae bacterium]
MIAKFFRVKGAASPFPLSKKALKPILSLMLLSLCGPICYGQDCKEIKQTGSSRTAYIGVEGKHCLMVDISISPEFDIHAGGFRFSSAAALSISPRLIYPVRSYSFLPNYPVAAEGDIEVDLGGHTVKSSEASANGIQVRGAHNVSIRNGKIKAFGSRDSLGIGIENGDGKITLAVPKSMRNGLFYVRDGNIGRSEYEDAPVSEFLDRKPASYSITNNLIDHVTVEAGTRGVVMSGGNNVLRNSTIYVDGHTAIYLYGPGSVIENNTIIIYGRGDATPADAAIKLRDGKDAIVRNNRIVYRGGWFEKAPAAINLHDSPNVVIEGNTVENFKALVRTVGDSNTIDQNNVLK